MISRYGLKAPTAEEESTAPSTKPLTANEYLQLLAGTFGEVARDTAELVRRARQAEERNAIVRVTAADFATMRAIPPGDWKYIIVNRPGVGEQALTTLNPYTLHLDNKAYYISSIGFAVYPYLGERQVGIFTTSLATSPVPTGNWSIEIIFTNRPDISSLLAAVTAPGGTTVTPAGGSIWTVAPNAGTTWTRAPIRGGLTDRSGTIALGGTSQALTASGAGRSYIFVANFHLTEDLWINFTNAASLGPPSIRIPPNGGSFVMESGFISTDAINVIAATTGHTYTAKEG